MGFRPFARMLNEKTDWDGDYQSVRKYEDKRTIPVKYLKAVCEACDVHPVWLLTGEGPKEWNRDKERRRDRLSAAAWMERCAEMLRNEAVDWLPPEPPLHDYGRAPKPKPGSTSPDEAASGEGP